MNLSKVKTPSSDTSQQTTTGTKLKEGSKKVYNYTAEKLGFRGLLIIGIVIGIIIFAIGLLLIAQSYIAIQDLYQMNNMGLIGTTQYNYSLYELYMQEANNAIIGAVGAIITAICLIIAAISPIKGQGTPYFSEFVRLGLLVFAAMMFYIAYMIIP